LNRHKKYLDAVGPLILPTLYVFLADLSCHFGRGSSDSLLNPHPSVWPRRIYKPPCFPKPLSEFPSSFTISCQFFVARNSPFQSLDMELKTLFFSLLSVTAAALPSASGSDPRALSVLAPRDQCAAAGPNCTGEKWNPDCPGGHCVPFQGPHIGFWCCVSCWSVGLSKVLVLITMQP
jgi:hypothetical protein